MKYALLLTLFMSSAWAKPQVLISYFDAFSGSLFNNSEKVARVLEQKLNSPESPFTVKLCGLNTVFDKAYAQSDECLKALPERPLMMLALGEFGCDELKVETMMRNMDSNTIADNDGLRRSGTEIIHGAQKFLGLRYPLPQMYCALSRGERSSLNLSNNAGSFVCNNTAYQMSLFHPEIQYGFIHVPASNCSELNQKNEKIIPMLEKMIKKGASYLLATESDEGLPHSSNEERLATSKDELKVLRRAYEDKDDCLREYLKRAKGFDEKRSLFGKN